MNKKNRKSIFLVLILFISIGFAVLTTNLSMVANLSFRENTFDVHFENVELLNSSTAINNNVEIDENDTTTISFSTTLTKPTDCIEFSFYAVNSGTVDAQISSIATTLTTEQQNYISYTLTYDSDGTTVSNNDYLHRGQYRKIIAHFEYKYDIDNLYSGEGISTTLTINYIQPQIVTATVWNYEYSGTEQYYIVPKTGSYKLEVWGAQGGPGENGADNGGKGGYSTGIVTLNKNDNLKIYVGQKGYECYGAKVCDGTFGGGGSGVGSGNSASGNDDQIGVGGGASDIRINSSSLYARVIVAGGGGGTGEDTNSDTSITYSGYGGGESGGSGYEKNISDLTEGYSIPGTQISSTGGGAFGQGAYNTKNCGGGGGGWYGGGSGSNKSGSPLYGQPTKIESNVTADCNGGGAGGSGWIYTESTYNYWAQNSTEGQSGNWLLNSNYYLTSASTKAGNQTFKSPSGVNEEGHSGNGFVRITYMG